jgi:phosphopantetheinyl transferase (holo-ACP synthase)
VKLTPSEFTIAKKGVRPVVVFASKEYARDYTIQLSISHTKTVAAALAVAIRCRV